MLLTEARKNVTSSRFIKMEEIASRLRRERDSTAIDPSYLAKVSRHVARINLQTFTVAVWNRLGIEEGINDFFRVVVPKEFAYSHSLFSTFVYITTWAAVRKIEDRVANGEQEEAEAYDVLQFFFPKTAEALGLSDSDQDVSVLLRMLKDKCNEMLDAEFVDECLEHGMHITVREKWIQVCYDILADFETLYPVSDTQKTIPDVDEEITRLEKDFHEQEEEEAEDVFEEAEEFVHKEDADEADDVFEEARELAEEEERVLREAQQQENREDESEQDELEDEDDVTTGEFSKRNMPDDDDEEEQSIESPKAKRPRVLPASSQDEGVIDEYDRDDQDYFESHPHTNLSSLQSLEDNPEERLVPSNTTNVVDNDELSTPDINGSQPYPNEGPENAQNPSSSPSPTPTASSQRQDEILPHGLPRTINEGPASPILETDKNEINNYDDAIQAAQPEQSRSVASARPRIRRDLPFTPQSASLASAPPVASSATQRVLHAHGRTYNTWSDDEIAALEEGLAQYGASNWAKIKSDHLLRDRLRNRTNVQLKDKARNEITYRRTVNVPLGVYECLEPDAGTATQNSAQRSQRRATIRRAREASRS
ncbi:hypothetical protein BDB00DRAFT_840334 [Zychaea mexicana]|uniref:uncharacterized protein n=1 Tax=Zychaea mexicana TaxID=64656 RepID=UPI0022FE146C|nr:uncharacterized protein BDB00DRAFT_840334 [Zychaea mexicana]KAI9489977.1 hypothetical protein BDB00DRAFT_840334 [Zychaea mexicana]